MKRVTPSTRTSTTMSALLMPDWGRALGWLSILTARTRRSSVSGSSTGRPFTGEVARSSTVVVGEVVVVSSIVVDVVVVDVEDVVVSSAPDEEQAERKSPNAVRTASDLRIGGMVLMAEIKPSQSRAGPELRRRLCHRSRRGGGVLCPVDPPRGRTPRHHSSSGGRRWPRC